MKKYKLTEELFGVNCTVNIGVTESHRDENQIFEAWESLLPNSKYYRAIIKRNNPSNGDAWVHLLQATEIGREYEMFINRDNPVPQIVEYAEHIVLDIYRSHGGDPKEDNCLDQVDEDISLLVYFED